MDNELLQYNKFKYNSFFKMPTTKVILAFTAITAIGLLSIFLELKNPLLKQIGDYKQLFARSCLTLTISISIIGFLWKKNTTIGLISKYPVAPGLFYISIFFLSSTLFSGSNTGTRGYIELPLGLGVSRPIYFSFLTLMILLAVNTNKYSGNLGGIRPCVVHFFAPVFILLLVGTPCNTSMALVVLATSVLYLYFTNVKQSYLLIFLIISIIGWLGIVILSARSGHNKLVSVITENEPLVLFDQTISTAMKAAFIEGGLFGQVWHGCAVQLPFHFAAYSFIWTSAVFGILGSIVIISVYALAFAAIWRIFKNTQIPLLSNLVLGLGLMLFITTTGHIVINIFCLPIDAVCLPFLQINGGPFVVNAVCLGLILSITQLDNPKSAQIYP